MSSRGTQVQLQPPGLPLLAVGAAGIPCTPSRDECPPQPGPLVFVRALDATTSELPPGSDESQPCLERGWFVFVLAKLAASGGRPRQHERPNLEGPLCRGRDQWEMEV